MPRAEPVQTNLGALVKQARRAQKLSLRDVAERAGLSASFIGQIERNATSPSLRSVRGLLDALDIKLSDMMDVLEAADGEPTPCVIAQDERKRVQDAISGVDIVLLTTPNDRSMQASLMVIRPGASSGEQPFQHQGEEIGYILVGGLTFRVESRDYELKTGDCISFKTTAPHSWINRGAYPCVALWVSTPVNY